MPDNLEDALQSEIDAMLSVTSQPGKVVDEEDVVDENEEVENEDTNDVVEDDDGGSEEDADDETDEDPTEEDAEEDEENGDSEVSDAEEDVDFRTTINDLAKKQLGVDDKVDDKVVEKEVEKQPPVKADEKMTYTPTFELTNDEFTGMFEKKENFTALMHKIENSQAVRMQQLIRVIPDVLTNLTNSVVNNRLALTDFYAANSDLVPFKALVEVTTNQIASKFPDKAVDELLVDVGKEVRKTLKLDDAGSKDKRRSTKKKRKPAIVDKKGGGTRKPPTPKLTGQEKEIADMINSRR